MKAQKIYVHHAPQSMQMSLCRPSVRNCISPPPPMKSCFVVCSYEFITLFCCQRAFLLDVCESSLTSKSISAASLVSGWAAGERKVSRMWNLVMASWRSGESGMVQFSWNWNVPVTSDHERMHWKSIGIGLSTE